MNRIDRQQRRLMRQRGTGATDVQDDVTFGFRFGSTPTPSSPRKSQTPASEIENRVPSGQKSSTGQRRVASRGTLEPLRETPEHTTSNSYESYSTPGTALGKRTREAVEDELASEAPSSTRASTARRVSSGVKHVSLSPVDMAPIGGGADDELGDDSLIILPAESSMRRANSVHSVRNERSESANVESVTMLDTPSAIPQKRQTQKQKARKSSSNKSTTKKKRKSTATRRKTTDSAEDPSAIDIVEAPLFQSARSRAVPNASEPLFMSEEPEARTPKDKRRQNQVANTQRDSTSMEDDLTIELIRRNGEQEEETTEDLSRSQMPPPPRPTNTGKNAKKRKANTNSIDNDHQQAPKRRKFTGKPIEITVYRRTKDPNVDFNPSEKTVLPAVNSADVLSQIVGEMGILHLENLQNKQRRSNPSNVQKVLKRRISTVQDFSARISDALFDVSNAQNAVYAIQSRLQKVKREQGNLRAELMKLKKERDDVNFRIDSVREVHARRAKEHDEKQELLGRLHDLDVAVQRGKLRGLQDKTRDGESDDEEDGPVEEGDGLLDEVTRFVRDGGLAGKLQRWNKLLVKASTALQA